MLSKVHAAMMKEYGVAGKVFGIALGAPTLTMAVFGALGELDMPIYALVMYSVLAGFGFSFSVFYRRVEVNAGRPVEVAKADGGE